MEQPRCTVVIPTRDRPTQLNACLQAVSRQTYPHFDVLVVENVTRSSEDVARRCGARYLFEPVSGSGAARECGARATEAEIVACLDDDSAPEPDWLSNLIREFTDPSIGVVTGRIDPLPPDTEISVLHRRIHSLCPPFTQIQKFNRETENWVSLILSGRMGITANMALRKSVYERWPGFDRRLGPGAVIPGNDDYHALFTLIDLGYTVVYTPHAAVQHPYARTLEQLQSRHLKGVVIQTSYLLMLLSEYPERRSDVLRYLQRKTGPEKGAAAARQIVPRRRTLAARLRGLFLYLRCLFTGVIKPKFAH